MGKERFNSIDGLRAISCLAIIVMHIRANTSYELEGYLWETIIPSWTWLVPLFLLISGFSMCAGYLDRFIAGNVDLEKFYARRYKKILPFFGFLILIAMVMEHSIEAFYEGSLELTLLYGFLPNNQMDVLGVCWTLGVIFVFYLLFPAYSVLMKDKKRAWLSFIISLWIVFVCIKHFFNSAYVGHSFTYRHSFIYCLPLFILGGVIYLYRRNFRESLKKFRWPYLVLCVIASIAWYLIPGNDATFIFYIKTLSLFGLWCGYAVGIDSKFLQSKILRYLSGISFEMYLAQMVIFRVVEKMHLLYIFGEGWGSFILSCCFVICGLVIFIELYKMTEKIVVCIVKKVSNNKGV